MTNIFLLALLPDVFVDRAGGNDHDGFGLFFLTDAVNALVALEEVLQVRSVKPWAMVRALAMST